VRVRCCVKTCSEIHAITWSGNGRARPPWWPIGLDLELHIGVGRVFGVVTVDEAVVRSNASLLRGTVSESVETASSHVPRRTVGENRQERRCDHLGSDGGAAGLIVGLMIVLDVKVASCMLLHRTVTSDRVESETSPTLRSCVALDCSRPRLRSTCEAFSALSMPPPLLRRCPPPPLRT